MVNKNRLLSEFDGANGIKTGFTGKAGHCFVGAAKRDDMQLISVVLASGWGDKGRSQKWVDTKAVLNYGFDNFSYKTIIVANEQAGKIGLTRSKTTELEYIYTADLTMALSTEEKGQVEVIVNVPPSIPAPINKGDVLGQAEVYLNGQLYASIDLTATESALRHDFKTSLEKVLNQWISQVLEEPIELTLPELPEFLDFLE
jgi:D-alanyl-D-alanine carboxypeptidase (penicillin-binding protein 5/6)